jgi:hypothetical protein
MQLGRRTLPWLGALFVIALCACANHPSSTATGHEQSSGGTADNGNAGHTAATSGGNGGTRDGQAGNPTAGSAGSARDPGSAGKLAAGAGGSTVRAGAGGGAAGSAGTRAAGSGGASGAGTLMHPYKGVANSPCAARSALNVSWYYNWMQNETEPCRDGSGGEFVPMVWGHTGDEQNATAIASAVKTFVSRGYTSVLGFNEPDNPSQSNIPVATAITLWPSFDVPGIRIGSPGTAANANPGQAWFKDFMAKHDAASLRSDFLAIHWYGWNAGSCDAKASQLESYLKWAEGFAGNRPIWITEWGCLNQSAPDAATVVTFFKAAVAMFAKHPRVERYSWYPWSTNCALNNKDGTLTELGTAYAAAPAYK